MFFPSDIDTPDVGSVTIRLPYASPALQIANFISYEYHESYLVPCDSWSFTFSADSMSSDDRKRILLGARVEASINGQTQTIGYLDSVATSSAANGGTVVTVEGRSWLSPCIDGHIDPQTKFTDSMTLDQFANTVLSPFGVTALVVENVANRNIITGATRGAPTSKKGKPLKSFQLHQEKPYAAEGAFAFLSRVCQRFGVWPRAGADGTTVIISTPDFDQAPSYSLIHRTDDPSRNNVLVSHVKRDRAEQPSVIFASGVGGGGEFAKATLRGAIINPLIAPPVGTLEAVLGAYPTVHAATVPPPAISSAILDYPIPDPNVRPIFLYDSESHTQAQLDAYLRRELALRMRKSLSAHYTILGHRLGGFPVGVDTIVDVQDDRSQLYLPLWVLSRRFSKHANGGTTTDLELIRPGTMVF